MNPRLTRHSRRSGRASARPRNAGTYRAGRRALQDPDSLAVLGFREDGRKSFGVQNHAWENLGARVDGWKSFGGRESLGFRDDGRKAPVSGRTAGKAGAP